MSNATARKLETHDIVVEDVFPHAPSDFSRRSGPADPTE